LRKSFSLLITLVFVIFIGIIGIMSLEFATVTNKHTSDIYIDTRAELISRAATEYAILAMQGHDYGGNCLKNINMQDDFFNINITYHYFLTDCNPDECNCSKIETADTNGSVLIYVTVTSKNKNFHIRKVRFTLQNP
jgi:hypothetical protein